MKLFQTYGSPFPSRVRLLLYAKGIEATIIQPPGFGASTESRAECLKVNPIGRVPALVLGDGRVLPESRQAIIAQQELARQRARSAS